MLKLILKQLLVVAIAAIATLAFVGFAMDTDSSYCASLGKTPIQAGRWTFCVNPQNVSKSKQAPS